MPATSGVAGRYGRAVGNLSRDDARARAAQITVEQYRVELDLAAGDQHFGSRSTIRFRAAGGSTFVDVAPHRLVSITLNGEPLDGPAVFDERAGRLRLSGLAEHNELVVEAEMTYSHDGEGLHRHVDPADGRVYTYAMSFLDAAPRWFACFDQPDLKAPLELLVRCPDDWVVSGNGPATRTDDGTWRIASAGPLATYFTTLVAGPYHVVRDDHDGIPLALLARQSLAEHLDRDAAELFGVTKHCFDELHRLFGRRYPWGEYHQAFVPEFNAGAMENPGCVTFRDPLVFRSKVTDFDRLNRAITVAHEMAHMWFGDLVTMRWWDDLWLNESFAEYLGQRVIGEQAWVSFGAVRKAWGYAADRRPSTHPVAGNGAPDARTALTEFDGISYAKGASVLRQLATHLGDDVFLAGLRDYIAEHAEGNAEFADLIGAWTAAGASDLDEWSRRWLRTTGLDDLAVADQAVLRRSAAGTPRTHAIAVASYHPDGTPVAVARVTVEADRTPIPPPTGPVTVPDAYDETWAKLVLPDDTWRSMPTLLPTIADARTRVAVWNALQLAAADAELDPARGVDLVVAALPAERDDSLIASVGRWAGRTLLGGYLDREGRAGAAARIGAAMLAVAGAADPGSSRQLAAARVAIATTHDVGVLDAWLAGASVPPGLLVDTELRWALLLRLAALGAVDGAAIDAELARDRSSQGAVHAARCRAVRPDPASKRAAWETLMTDADRPNYELYALAEGFWDPDQLALTREYVDEYFTRIPEASRLRTGWVADRVALLAYPWPAVADSTLAATERLLAGAELPAGVRRSVVDAGDDLRRALAVRRRFGLAPDVA
jgi:aminopeptidase N